MSNSQNPKFRIRSSANKKSDSVQDYVKSSCIPRRCRSSRPNLPSGLSVSKRNGRLDSSESDMNVEGMRKKLKTVSQVTMEAEKSKVPLDSVVSKPAKLTGRSFKIRFKRGREVESVSGKETSNVSGGRSPILSSNLKQVKSNEDQENIPSQKRLALEDNSADIRKTVKEIKEKCAKRMEKLIQEQKGKIQEFHRVWEDNMSQLENDRKLEAAIIRSIYGNGTITIDKLAILDDKFAKKMAENNLEKDKQLRDLEAEHSAAKNEEIQKEANSLSEAKSLVSSKPTAYRKEQPLGSQHEEVSRRSKSRTHILGAKDAMALTEQHEKDSDSSITVKRNHVERSKNSDRATAEEVACKPSCENPSSAKKMAENNLEKDRQLRDLEAEHSTAKNEEIQKEASSLSEAKSLVSSKPTAYRKEQPLGSQHEEVTRCSKSRTHFLGAKDAMALTEQHEKDGDSSITVKRNHVERSKNSDRATAEEVACKPSCENPSSAKKMAENNLEKDKQLRDLEAEHSTAKNEEIQKEANSLSEAKSHVSSKPTAYRKEQPFGSQHVEVSRCSKSRTHILGAKDAIAPTEQHGKDSDSSITVKRNHVERSKNSDRATAEEVACKPSCENLSSAAIYLKLLDVENNLQKDKQLKDLEAEQSATRNEEIQKEVNSLSEAKACVSSKPTAYSKEQPFGSQHEEVSRCSKSRTHILGAKDAMALTVKHGQNSDSSRTVKANRVVRSKNSDHATAEEVACNPFYGNPSGEANSSKKKGGGISDSDIRISAVVEKINLPMHLGAGGSILANLETSGEMQLLELHGEVPSKMPETVAYEMLDEDAIDLPDAEQLAVPEHFGCAEKISVKPPDSGERAVGDMQFPNLCKDIPAEWTETDDEIVDNVNPMELSANTSINGFGEETAINFPDALLNQRNKTDRTTIDDLDLAGKVREEQDVVPSEIQGHVIEEAGRVNSSLSEIATAELVDTARESLSNIEPQASEELALETQSSSRAEASELKVTDTVIAKLSSVQIQDQNTSVVKDQVTSQIEAADSERVDTAASVSASEHVGTVKTLESYNKLQDNTELEIETRSMSWIEVSYIEDMNNRSHMLSSIEQQDEDAVIITNRVNLETEASNSLLPDNATPEQSHTDAPSIESDEKLQLMNIDASPSRNHLPSPELESQNHNLARNSSGAAVTEILSHASVDLDNSPDVRDELTSVQISASVQNNVATEEVLSANEVLHDAVLQFGGLTHLPINQISPSLFADPLQNELEIIKKESEELQKIHDELIEGLNSECKKEMQELFDAVKKKYQLKIQDTRAQFVVKNNGLCQRGKKILMNKMLADSFNYSCLNMSSIWPALQQGFPSSSMQYHQHMVRPAGACAPNQQIASPIGQAMPQISVPGSTRGGPITSQHFAPPCVQPTPYFEALRRQGTIFGVHPTSLPHFGGDIYSSAQQFQSSILGPAQSIPNATLISSFQNMQQPQQPLAAPQWQSNFHNPQHHGYPPSVMHTPVSSQCPSNFHNPQHRGYPPAVMPTSVSSFDSLMDVEHLRRHHQLLGAVRGQPELLHRSS
ncbi:uncharacterized protein LOC125186751 [Salvia hispanica]|uniref:uncharacterized protein LOC125186751 n=1 Tax=Salvia hispanica TaxID=49212 RepID=UPI00200974CB|nr:uncharacterized protein LOC125186751 [Salvia hispanica]XP_047939155.1 uncharacterized protein LOC125186751 [Salvia hispanica]